MAERREMEMWAAEEAMLDALVEHSDDLAELTARYECLKEEHKQLLAVEGGPFKSQGAAGHPFYRVHVAGSMLLGRLKEHDCHLGPLDCQEAVASRRTC